MDILAFLFHLNKSHLLQNLIEEHVVDLLRSGGGRMEAFDHYIVLLNELLGHIFLIVEIQDLLWKGNAVMALTLEFSCPFLPSKSILVQQLIYRSISGQSLAHLGDLWTEIFTKMAISIIFVLFVFQTIEPVKNSALLLPFLNLGIRLRTEGIFYLLFFLQILFHCDSVFL